MFVSGPSGTSVTGRPARGSRSAMKETRRPRRAALVARRQQRAVEPALAVDVRGDDELAAERPVGARRDGDVRAADELEDAERVGGRLLERLVAVRRRHAEQLDLRAREREQERDRVVVPGIAVEDDRCRRTAGVSCRRAWQAYATRCATSRSRCRRRSRTTPGARTVVKVRGKIFVFLGTGASTAADR